MHSVLHGFEHPNGVSVLLILAAAFVLGFVAQRALAAIGNRWWPMVSAPQPSSSDDPGRDQV